ncbi:hypothetical protein CCYA_CCYA06G1950 [Cyanidiococcus yangmingshanensis]|nr:hypothetical protein CCYA_CCYA06G1950 [Cyanidiococcus yangmingshanensis]
MLLRGFTPVRTVPSRALFAQTSRCTRLREGLQWGRFAAVAAAAATRGTFWYGERTRRVVWRLCSQTSDQVRAAEPQQHLEKQSSGPSWVFRVYLAPELRAALRVASSERKGRVFVPGAEPKLDELYAVIRERFVALKKLHGTPLRVVLVSGKPDSNAVIDSDARLKETGQMQVPLYLRFDPQLDPSLVEQFRQRPRGIRFGGTTLQTRQLPPFYPMNKSSVLTDDIQMLSFYRFVSISEPEELASRLRFYLKPLAVRGRIYIATEGVNAQVAVPVSSLDAFQQLFAPDAPYLTELAGIYLNMDPYRLSAAQFAEQPPFRNLHIRCRRKIVADGLKEPLDLTQVGRELSPAEWQKALEDPHAILLDVRNDYETQLGTFQSAGDARPLNTRTYRETWKALEERLANEPRDRRVLTFCTGGIRCVKAAAYLQSRLGFQRVERLGGGIVSYAAEAKRHGWEPKFKGSVYVFDERLKAPVTNDVLSRCETCGGPTQDILHCAHVPCHRRLIQCPNCRHRLSGCCSSECQRGLELALASATNELHWYTQSMNRTAPWGTEASILKELAAETYRSFPQAAHMMSGPVQGALLQAVARLLRAQRVLEIGTFTGYATLCFAGAMGPNNVNQVVTVERDPESADIAEHFFQRATEGMAPIRLYRGAALDVLQLLWEHEEPPFDLIYLDADKRQYIAYYEFILERRLLAPHGALLVDNVLFRPVYGKQRHADLEDVELGDRAERIALRSTKLMQAVHEFNKHVQEDARVTQVILPIRDGVSIIQWSKP